MEFVLFCEMKEIMRVNNVQTAIQGKKKTHRKA
jgi:hypothetical protein